MFFYSHYFIPSVLFLCLLIFFHKKRAISLPYHFLFLDLLRSTSVHTFFIFPVYQTSVCVPISLYFLLFPYPSSDSTSYIAIECCLSSHFTANHSTLSKGPGFSPFPFVQLRLCGTSLSRKRDGNQWFSNCFPPLFLVYLRPANHDKEKPCSLAGVSPYVGPGNAPA